MLPSGNRPDGNRRRQVTSTADGAGDISRETSLIQMLLYLSGSFCF